VYGPPMCRRPPRKYVEGAARYTPRKRNVQIPPKWADSLSGWTYSGTSGARAIQMAAHTLWTTIVRTIVGAGGRGFKMLPAGARTEKGRSEPSSNGMSGPSRTRSAYSASAVVSWNGTLMPHRLSGEVPSNVISTLLPEMRT